MIHCSSTLTSFLTTYITLLSCKLSLHYGNSKLETLKDQIKSEEVILSALLQHSSVLWRKASYKMNIRLQ